MPIDDYLVETAVLQTLSQLRLSVGDMTTLAGIEPEWARNKMRHSDLTHGLQLLVELGDLEGVGEAPANHFVLTEQGFRRCRALPKSAGFSGPAATNWVSRRSHRVVAGALPPEQWHRRATDHLGQP